MKKTFLTLLLIVMSAAVFAQQWTCILSNNPATIKTQLISSSENSIKVNVQVPGFYANTVTTPRGEANVISVPKTVSTFSAGEPNLPMIAIPAIIGDAQRYSIRIINAQYADFEINVAPSKGDFPRSINPDDVPYTYGEAYNQDAFFPANQIGLYEPYILRDFRGQNMVIYPFAYNPATQTLRVYYDLTVEMFGEGMGGENQLTRKSNSIKMDSEMKALYANQFINYRESTAKYTVIDEEGDLLIICHDAFMDAMTPFVNWKKQIGRPTTMVGTSTAGTTDQAIHSYIEAQYNANPNLMYVLLVGDVAQIPGHSYSTPGYGGKSDNWYGQIVGSDYYNDIFVGRFSAESTDHVTNQVNKVIHYERDINASDTWLSIGSGVATTSQGGHFNEQDYQHIDNIRDDLLGYTYTNVHRDYQSVSGCQSSAAILSEHINEGLSIINYCNHGSATSWGVFGYSNNNINALTNVNKLPIVWSVACLNGKYDHYQPCFAETWLRANNGSTDQPTGAIGGMFSYISQPWLPPMYGQDEMVDILVESYSSNIKRTLAGTSMNGNLKILDQYGQGGGEGLGTYMSWILYGDPTLTLRNAIPENMNVTHGSSIGTGSTSFTVNASNGNGARATLTRNNEIMGSAIINNGNCNITFTAPGQTGAATLTVFGYNKITYIATINITAGGGPEPVSVTCTATPNVIAQGGSATLNAIATGGDGSFTYHWTPAIGLNNANIQSPTATPTQTTTYTCTVTSGGQTGTATATVTVVCAPSNLTANVVNNSNVNLSWTAANPAQSYKIYRNNSVIAQNITTTNYTDQNLSAGTYNYQVATIYNGIESPKSNTATATIYAPLTATATAIPAIIAEGESATLSVYPQGGNGTYTYSWSPAASLDNANIQSPTATPSQTTTYTCTVTSGGQTETATATITVVCAPSNLTANLVNNSNVNLSWTAANPAQSYKIYRNNSVIAQNITATNYTDQNLSAGTYNYQVATIYNGIESPKSNTATVTIYTPLTATATASPAIIAQGESATLSAHPQGGNGTYTYSWSPAASLNNANIQSPTATPSQTTTYTVTITCGSETVTATATVTVVKAPTNVHITFGEHPTINWAAIQPFTSFNVYRGEELIASNITGMSYTDTDVVPCPEEEYCYSVATVYNLAVAHSDEVCDALELFLFPVRNAEGEYVWNMEDNFGANLTWEAPDETLNCWGMTGFNIYREEEINKSFELIANVPAVEGQNDYQYFDSIRSGYVSYIIKAVYEKDGEMLESEGDVIELNITAVQENEAHVSVFPNPTNGMINIKAENISHVSIFNIFGQGIMNADIDNDSCVIDMSQFTKGIYMLKIETANGLALRRVVVE